MFSDDMASIFWFVVLFHSCALFEANGYRRFLFDSDQDIQGCQQNSDYNDVMTMKDASACITMDGVWSKLYPLFSYSRHIGCGKLAIRQLAEHFRNIHPSCICDQHRSRNEISWSGSRTDQILCSSKLHPVYTEIYDDTFQTQHSYHHNRVCYTHSAVWPKLDIIDDDDCLSTLIKEMHLSFTWNSGDNDFCNCNEAGQVNVTLSTPGSVVTSSNNNYYGCEQYSEYRHFENLIAHDNCMSMVTDWELLKSLSHKSVHCRIVIVDKLSHTYGNLKGTPSNCTCSQNYNSINVPGNLVEHNYCSSESQYSALFSKLFHQNDCSSHHSVWKILSSIPHNGDNDHSRHYIRCQKNAIDNIAETIEESHASDACQCKAAVSTTKIVITKASTESTTVLPTTFARPTTTPTYHDTSIPTGTLMPTHTSSSIHNQISYFQDVHMCTRNDSIGTTTTPLSSLNCGTTGHARAEAFATGNCNSSGSSTWIKGYQVTNNCEKIPRFTLIASFAGNFYTHDGLFGELISCTSSTIRVGIMDCDGHVKIVDIDNNNRDSYTHIADNFYTVKP